MQLSFYNYIRFPCSSLSFLVPITLVCIQIYLAFDYIQHSELLLLFTQFVLVYFVISHKIETRRHKESASFFFCIIPSLVEWWENGRSFLPLFICPFAPSSLLPFPAPSLPSNIYQKLTMCPALPEALGMSSKQANKVCYILIGKKDNTTKWTHVSGAICNDGCRLCLRST